MHYIQARLSREHGLGEPRTIRDVAGDGTITFADGTTRWHHDPLRLRLALVRYGAEVRLGTHGVLRVPDGGGSTYCFCVSETTSPCRSETAEDSPVESLSA
jgi:hypothetical protein